MKAIELAQKILALPEEHQQMQIWVRSENYYWELAGDVSYSDQGGMPGKVYITEEPEEMTLAELKKYR
jgi:hypothetical protein